MGDRTSQSPPGTADEALAQLRAHPEWTGPERDAALDRLVERFPTEAVVEAVRARLHDLGGGDAEAILRLVEANPGPDLVRRLAEALDAQQDLPPERAWDALAVLDGAGVLVDHPALAERWDELNEGLDDEGSVEQLVAQIEDDPEGVRLALQGLAAVEPEVRPEIVAGLGRVPLGPGLVEFLRLLAHAHDLPTRTAALSALAADPGDAPGLLAAWEELAANHPDEAVATLARSRLGPGEADPPVVRAAAVPTRLAPRVVRSLVTRVDGRGRGTIVLSSEQGGEFPTAAFLCDVERGVVEVFGDVATGPARAAEAFGEIASQTESDALEGAHDLAIGLLAGSLLLCGPASPPALRYWVESTAGRAVRPHPFRASFPGWDPAELPFDETPGRAREVLGACRDWLDTSPMTYELAEEIQLRYGESGPNPLRDAGAYRFLFEHGLRGQLERYRRMLLWMAWYWRSGGDGHAAQSALGLAWQLSDPQHVVPGHPFTVALTTRSLLAAQADLKRGTDPRVKPAR